MAHRALFWPQTLRKNGLIYGWLNDDGSACAVGVLPDISVRSIRQYAT
jgi:hypothetical protein